MKNLNEMTKAKNLVGTEINEMEYIDHILIENNETYFQIIHLNGSERLIKIEDLIK